MAVLDLRLADEVDSLLPQTQCTRCGFDACRPYAEALAEGTATINRCPPGGDETIDALSRLLKRPVLPLDPECGEPTPLCLALIEERGCIGCTLCIQVCPVDAIVGAAKRMHSVLVHSCTGCELCVPACPTDCIAMIEPVSYPHRTGLSDAWTPALAAAARARFERRGARLERVRRQRQAKRRSRALRHATREDKREAVSSAVMRVRQRRASRADDHSR